MNPIFQVNPRSHFILSHTYAHELSDLEVFENILDPLYIFHQWVVLRTSSSLLSFHAHSVMPSLKSLKLGDYWRLFPGEKSHLG